MISTDWKAAVVPALLVATLLVSSALGCGTRMSTDRVYAKRGIELTLRKQMRGFDEVERGFEHPTVISRERMANILTAIDVEMKEKKKPYQRNAISADLLRPIAAALSDGLEKAGPNEEVVVNAVRRVEMHGIFNRKYLTSLVAYEKDGALFLYISRIDWEIPKHREDNLPLPVAGERVMDFRSIASKRIYPVGQQGYSIAWRDDLFRKPARTFTGNEGIRKKEILMEEQIPQEELGTSFSAPEVSSLSPEQLRALADLEEARRSGSVTEAEYARRRDALLGR